MKIPIEFINSDSKEFAQDILNMTVDLAAAKHRHFNISLQKSSAENITKTQAVAIAAALVRAVSALKELDELIAALKTSKFDILTDVIVRKYRVFDDINVDAMLTEIGYLDSIKSILMGKINGLLTMVAALKFEVNSSLEVGQSYSEQVTKHISVLDSLIARILAIDTTKPESDIGLLLETSNGLLENLQKRIEAFVPTEPVSIALVNMMVTEDLIYAVDSFLNILEGGYRKVKRTYDIYDEEYRFLLKEAKRLYSNILNGAYIRSGEFIVASKHEVPGFMTVNAWFPPQEPCETPEPQYMLQDIIVEQLTTVCPKGGRLGSNNFEAIGGYVGMPTSAPTSAPTAAPTSLPDSAVINSLALLKSCNPDYGYWKKENSTDKYVEALSSNTGQRLSASNADHVVAARDFFKASSGINIDLVSDFYYGLSATAIRAERNALVIGKMSTDKATYDKSISKFYACLYSLYLTSLKTNNLAPTFADWATFQSAASSAGLSYSKAELLSFFLTYRWQTIADVGPAFAKLTNDDGLIEKVAQSLTGQGHCCQRFSFHEAHSQGTILGYAIQNNDNHVRMVNVEPDSFNYSAKGQTPMMFKGGQFRALSFSLGSNGQSVTRGAYFAAERPGQVDQTLETGIAEQQVSNLMYTAIHEAAHSVDYAKGLDANVVKGFSEQSAWLAISGWKKNSNGYYFDQPFKYPSELSASDLEPPCTIYGCTYPWEDFAEAWTFYIMAPAVLSRWYPKKHRFLENNVVPFMKGVKR